MVCEEDVIILADIAEMMIFDIKITSVATASNGFFQGLGFRLKIPNLETPGGIIGCFVANSKWCRNSVSWSHIESCFKYRQLLS
jgi:hypothetical protein